MKWPFKKREKEVLSQQQQDQATAADRVRHCEARFRKWEDDFSFGSYKRTDYFSRASRNEINDLFLSDLSELTELPSDIYNLYLLERFSIGRSESVIMKVFNEQVEVFDGATRISKIDCLSGLRELREVNLSGTNISDLSPLKDAINLEVLDIESTRVKSLEPIKHLPKLRSIYMANSLVEDLSPLASLPAVSSDVRTQFGIKGIPALIRDPALALIARLGIDGNSEDLVSYLQGAHPAFEHGNVHDSAQGRELLASSSPVSFELVGGRVEAVNRPEFAPIRLAENQSRLETVRQLSADLVEEAKFLQVPSKLQRRLGYYCDKSASADPIFLVLEGTMAYVRGALADEFIVEATDAGFINACRHLVKCHDAMREVYLPIVDAEITAGASQEVEVDALVAVIEESKSALADDSIRPSVAEAIESITGYAEAASENKKPREKNNLIIRGFVLLGGLLTKLSASATLHTWANSAAGKAVLARIKPIIDYVLEILGLNS